MPRILGPFEEFLEKETVGGLLLLLATVAALVWANSTWADAYHHFWETPVSVGAGSWTLSKTLHHWVNDGLMAVFFFVVGLEIKREMLVGELASLRQAALPVVAAVGGMVVPALLYLAVNAGGEGAAGWGIPMATDIAFALGVLALVAPGVPTSLKVFLTALAIADDLGAVVVIALFYTAEVSGGALVAAGLVGLLLAAANVADIRRPTAYAILGAALWLAFLESGVHPTVAGVLAALAIPARTRIDADEFIERSREAVDAFGAATPAPSDDPGGRRLPDDAQLSALHALDTALEGAEAPLQRLEHALLPWVTFFIMPVFALANAGVDLGGGGGALLHPVSIGVVVGLVVGKPLGIGLASWLAVRSGLARLPDGVAWPRVVGVASLAGIGFTMSLFIGSLAFGGGALLEASKMGILAASLVSAVVGAFLLRGRGSAP